MNAEAACMTSPRVMVPATYFGAHRRIGMIGARPLLLWDTIVVRMYCNINSYQRCRTIVNDPSRPARSSLSPPNNAMLSPCSRRREPVPVVRLRLVLVLGDRDKATSDHDHRSA